MKRKCSRCGEEKELSEFYLHNREKNLYDSRCKDCSRQGVAEFRARKAAKTHKPKTYCRDCRKCSDTGCRHNKRTA